jgi:hypothetical protein
VQRRGNGALLGTGHADIQEADAAGEHDALKVVLQA